MRALLLIILLLPCFAAQANPLQRFEVDQGAFLIDWRDDFTPAEMQKLQRWLEHMGAAISSLHGEWPRERIRIAFKRYRAKGPVPFGRVLRNSPEGILFYVNPELSLNAFINDWTAYHEFSHLFIPYPGQADSWFSEGLASYYQNILQVRAGVLTADEAYQRFAAAFQRGEDNDEHDDLTLGELSTDMMKRRAFMRIYWSGALYFMQADLLLRQTDQATTLDNVVRSYNGCCMSEGEEQRARQIATEFDRIAGSTLFIELYDRYENSRAIPEWREILDATIHSGSLSAAP
jgi:hypothetical protein